MILTTYNSEQLYVFWYPANWKGNGAVKTTLSMPSKLASGKSARQERTPQGESLRIPKMSFSVLLDRYQAVELKEALLAHTTERIAAPFWPLARPSAEFAALPIKGSINVTYETESNGLGYPDFNNAFEIHAGDTPAGSFSALAWTAPLLLCDWAKRPSPNLDTDETSELKVSLVEDSDADEALIVSAQSFGNGPTLPDASIYKVFPLLHDFSVPATSGGTELLIDAVKIGQGRRRFKDYHGAPANRPLGMRATFDTIEDAALLLKFFQDHFGMVTPFWAPAYLAETRITGDVAAASTIVNVEDASSLALHGWIAILTPTGIAYRTVASINGNELTLDAPIGIDVARDSSSLTALLLTRFDKRVLQVAWDTDISGSASIKCIEVSPEYVEPANETRGVTLGDLPNEGSFYEFTGAGQVWRYACYEQDISYGVNTYPHINISHGDIEQGILLEDNCSMEAVGLECEPLMMIAMRQIASLDVVIYKGEISGGVASNVEAVFHGRVVSAVMPGLKVQAKCQYLGKDLDLQFPKQMHQRVCKYALYGPGCELAASDWTFSAAFVDVGTPGYPYAFTIGSITRDNAEALPTFFANWFAWGKVWVGTGEGRKKATISQSTALAGGQIVLTLDRDFEPFPENLDTLKLRPACDGQRGTCKAYDAGTNPSGKFDNYGNYGGVNVARGNLSLIKVSADAGGGKK